jgi:hypothetical protein
LFALFAMFISKSEFAISQDQSPSLPPPTQVLSPDQLNDLVAPIALYPDPLLSQIIINGSSGTRGRL